MKLNKGILALLPVVLLLNANASVDAGSNYDRKTVKGYNVKCFATGDLDFASIGVNHKSTNLCDIEAVNKILTAAGKIKNPNFPNGLKLIKYSPNKPSGQFMDYAFVVVVNEKAKRIDVSNTIYGINKMYMDGQKVKSSYKLGGLNSDNRSYLFTFENNNWLKDKELVLTASAGNHGMYEYTVEDVTETYANPSLAGMFYGYQGTLVGDIREADFSMGSHLIGDNLDHRYSIKHNRLPD